MPRFVPATVGMMGYAPTGEVNKAVVVKLGVRISPLTAPVTVPVNAGSCAPKALDALFAVTVNGALLTMSVALAVAVVKFVVSVGVKVTFSVCVPAFSTSPADGLYTKVPGVFAVALS